MKKLIAVVILFAGVAGLNARPETKIQRYTGVLFFGNGIYTLSVHIADGHHPGSQHNYTLIVTTQRDADRLDDEYDDAQAAGEPAVVSVTGPVVTDVVSTRQYLTVERVQ